MALCTVPAPDVANYRIAKGEFSLLSHQGSQCHHGLNKIIAGQSAWQIAAGITVRLDNMRQSVPTQFELEHFAVLCRY